MMHWTTGHMGFGWIWQLVIFLLFFIVVFWLLTQNRRYGFSSTESAEDILKKRLARGEIDTKEFKRLKKEIE